VAAAVNTQQISIIIPALNEENTVGVLCDALQPLRQRGHEVILVDGGSTDQTIATALPQTDKLISAPRGRALQMRAGAAAAKGSVFWFLHADTGVPEQADQLILDALENQNAQWGRFDIALSDRQPLLACVAFMMNLRSSLTSIATGDQGIFVRRSLYQRVGGIPSIPLMEDIAFSRSLKAYSRPVCVGEQLLGSARRWNKHGIIRTIVTMWGLRLAYYCGVSPERLEKYYAVDTS
jgi:rSAM/selenodomain-associated transferase 2